MADFSNSPNMTLPIPNVGVAPGPDWASLLNSCLTILDGHSHVPGSGVQITPDAININSDLPYNGNNLTLARSLRMSAQGSPLALAADIGALYVSGVDLYYNDINGAQIRITQSGGIVGTSGSISNLVSPASASYVSGTSTFVWESNANVPANMDFASAIFRNLSVSSFGLTLQPPAAMGSDYTITLPQLPVTTRILSIDPSGNMGAGVAGAIVTNDLANQSVTFDKLYARPTGTTVGIGGVAISGDSGPSQSTNQAGFITINNQTVTITTTGRPVAILITNTAGVTGSYVTSGVAELRVLRDSSVDTLRTGLDGGFAGPIKLPLSFSYVDTPAAGTHTYETQFSGTGLPLTINNATLIVYEL